MKIKSRTDLSMVIGVGHGETDGWDINCTLGLMGGQTCVSFGWGWSATLPLRLWPASSELRARRSYGFVRHRTWGWCGFFVGRSVLEAR